jgi:cation-dependent mannose-6-phosphate receptor
MRLSRATPLFCLAAAVGAAAEAADTADSSTPVHPPACTATSSTGSGAFFDLRPDIVVAPGKSKSSYSSATNKDYHIRGYDYNKNFTLNICSPVVEPVKDVSGVSETAWANVSAYYTSFGDVYSIGYVETASI